MSDSRSYVDQIKIESMVASRDGEPFVVLKWGKEAGQLTPEEARQHALSILEAAEGAETDAFMVKFLRERLEVDQNRALRVLSDLRGYRAAQAERRFK